MPLFQPSKAPQLGIHNRCTKVPLSHGRSERGAAATITFPTQARRPPPATTNHAQRLPRWCVSRNPIPLFQALSTIGHITELPELFRLRRPLESFSSYLFLPCWHDLLLYKHCLQPAALLQIHLIIAHSKLLVAQPRGHYLLHSRRSFQDFTSTAI